VDYDIATRDEIRDLYHDEKVALANSFIQARKRTSLMESKIELLAIYRMNESMKSRKKPDAEGELRTYHYVELCVNDIKAIAERKGGSLYNQMAAVAVSLSNRKFIFKDERSNYFKVSHLYHEVEYNDGTLDIEFEPENEKLFLDLKDNYSLLNLEICFKFSTVGGLQLYKMLKSHVYELQLPEYVPGTSQDDCPSVSFPILLSDLRLQLGYVDLNQPDIELEAKKKKPNADILESLEKKPKYKRWDNFKKNVVDVGIDEINKISDIYINGVTKKCGAHGKVEEIIFSFQRNATYEEKRLTEDKKNKRADKREEPKPKKPLSDDEIYDFIDKMRVFVKEDITTKDLKTIAETAGYDIDKVKKAYEVMEMTEHVENVVGFMISAINNDYEKPVFREKDARKNSKIHNFTERKYTKEQIIEMEKELLKKK